MGGASATCGLWAKSLSADRLFVGTSDAAAVDVYGLDGRRITEVPMRFQVPRPSRQDYDRAIDDLVAMLSGDAARKSTKTMLLDMAMPEHRPAHCELFADNSGTFWTISVPADSVTTLRAISADGKTAWEVTIPASLKVFEVGHDYMSVLIKMPTVANSESGCIDCGEMARRR